MEYHIKIGQDMLHRNFRGVFKKSIRLGYFCVDLRMEWHHSANNVIASWIQFESWLKKSKCQYPYDQSRGVVWNKAALDGT